MSQLIEDAMQSYLTLNHWAIPALTITMLLSWIILGRERGFTYILASLLCAYTIMTFEYFWRDALSQGFVPRLLFFTAAMYTVCGTLFAYVQLKKQEKLSRDTINAKSWLQLLCTSLPSLIFLGMGFFSLLQFFAVMNIERIAQLGG